MTLGTFILLCNHHYYPSPEYFQSLQTFPPLKKKLSYNSHTVKFTPFQVNNSVVFSLLTRLCHHRCYLIAEYFNLWSLLNSAFPHGNILSAIRCLRDVTCLKRAPLLSLEFSPELLTPNLQVLMPMDGFLIVPDGVRKWNCNMITHLPGHQRKYDTYWFRDVTMWKNAVLELVNATFIFPVSTPKLPCFPWLSPWLSSLSGVICTAPNSRLWTKPRYSPYCICIIYTFLHIVSLPGPITPIYEPLFK